LADSSFLLIAKAARPKTVFEAAGFQALQLNDTSGASLPVIVGSLTDTTWVSEYSPALLFSALEVMSVQVYPSVVLPGLHTASG